MKPTYEELEAQVKQLAAEREAVVAENMKLKSAIKIAEPWLPSFDDEFSQRVAMAKSTPATDAAIASPRAEGVEILRQHPAIQLCSLTHVCDEVAAQIRSQSAPSPETAAIARQFEQAKEVQS